MNIAQLERDLSAKQEEARTLFSKTAQDAEKEKRERTDEEKAAVQALVNDATQIKARIERAKGDENQVAAIEKLTAGLQSLPRPPTNVHPRVLKSIGQQFTENDEIREFIKRGGHRKSSAWVSPMVETYAATLTEDAASGGDLIVTDNRPGIQELLFKKLTVGDLPAQGTTTSNSITYMKETTFTNAANSVAEGASKPESTLIFDLVNEPVRKLAHWLPVTEEMLEDVPAIRSYIDNRLRFGVEVEEEDQLLNGTTTPPDIVGYLARTGLGAAVARGAMTNAEAVFTQQMALYNASFLMPDAVVMNPANWSSTQLMKDTAGQYFGGGPFVSPQTPTLWGVRVVVTPSIVANTALVGAFKQASQVFRHGGIRVEASNSHSDYFIKNLVAIRAEERLALAVYRPGAFGTVTGLS